ncbi:MAG: hypothetical protein HY832_00750 [Candidatus Aenigmarchaeota archaeon]|nr:hypothetical protein [Candidatus Aenigmarchaeota archaeon]
MWKDSKGTLTVAVTNQQSQAQSVTATLLGGWFIGDVTSIAGNTYNQGQAKSLDFSVTPSNDGSQAVCVRMGTTCSADCGMITINSNADLSIPSFTTSSSSVVVNSAFTASATIQNSGTQTAGSTSSVIATLSGTRCTIASAAKTVGTIAGKSSTSQSWTVTAGSTTGTCALVLSVSGTSGGSASSTASVTVTTVSGTTDGQTSSSGGGGGGGGSANATNKTTTATTVPQQEMTSNVPTESGEEQTPTDQSVFSLPPEIEKAVQENAWYIVFGALIIVVLLGWYYYRAMRK